MSNNIHDSQNRPKEQGATSQNTVLKRSRKFLTRPKERVEDKEEIKDRVLLQSGQERVKEFSATENTEHDETVLKTNIFVDTDESVMSTSSKREEKAESVTKNIVEDKKNETDDSKSVLPSDVVCVKSGKIENVNSNTIERKEKDIKAQQDTVEHGKNQNSEKKTEGEEKKVAVSNLLASDLEPQKQEVPFYKRVYLNIMRQVKRVTSVLFFMFRVESIVSFAFLFFITASLIGFVVWASYFSLEKTVKAPGGVLAVTENQIISHLEGGVIEEVFVEKGTKVKKNQELMRVQNLDISRERDEFLIKEQYLKAVLMRLRAELFESHIAVLEESAMDNPDLEEQYRVFLQNKSSLEQKINILETQEEKIITDIESAKIHLKNIEYEYELAQEQVKMLSPLVDHGVGSKQLLLQRTADMARSRTATSETRERIKSLELSLREASEKIKEEKAVYLQKAQEEMASVSNELRSVISALSSLSYSISRNLLRSPVEGTVLNILNSTEGGVVRAGDALFEIVPDAPAVKIEAKVQPQDRAAIYIGQKAKVRPSMYSFSLDTMLITKISSISPQTFFDDITRTYYYRVFLEADVDSAESSQSVEHVKNVAKSFLPGMTVEVNIISGEESLMDYFLTPIMRGLNNSLTERSTK